MAGVTVQDGSASSSLHPNRELEQGEGEREGEGEVEGAGVALVGCRRGGGEEAGGRAREPHVS